MDINLLEKKNDTEWYIAPHGKMHVPAIIYAGESLIQDMDFKVYEQICNVACLPGIVQAAYAMPDAHWGYGFPIGGVAAFDPEKGGVISAGGVGFDISCGVRLLTTELIKSDIESIKEQLADVLFNEIPAGVGSRSTIHLKEKDMDEMLRGGASWAVQQGYGKAEDLQRIEEQGCMAGALPEKVSMRAKERQKAEMGTLGSGNHYLEIQEVKKIYNEKIANTFGLYEGAIVVCIHCGSRGLGHQIGTEYLRAMAMEATQHGIALPDRELACAPLKSELGKSYLGAMRAAINCALANRQIVTHFAQQAFNKVISRANLKLIYDVSHNTCKEEIHLIDDQLKHLFIHRKGATRALPPNHPDLPIVFKESGQPVIIGGSMGTSSYILAGAALAEKKSFSSACHGAGRAMSRHEATRHWQGKQLVKQLAEEGILIRSVSYRGVAEEAPAAYKDVSAVVEAADNAGLTKKVAKLVPIICIKG